MPRSSVTFRCAERANRIALWIRPAFLLEEKTLPAPATDSLHVGFLSTRSTGSNDSPHSSPLFIVLSAENGGQMTIRTENMELAADIVQDMCRYLKVCDNDLI